MSKLTIPLYQSIEEVAGTAYILGKLGCKSYLEIGSRDGLSLHCFGYHCDKIVSVSLDDEPNRYENKPLIKAKIYERKQLLESRGKEVILIRGDSTTEDCIQQATQHGPYDCVFIDGGHDLATATSDWLNYGPLATKAVVFHDINPSITSEEVPILWAQLKETRPHLEIIDSHAGTGIIFKTKEQ